MGKITVDNLAALLRDIDNAPPVDVSEAIKAPAKTALERMLEVCA
jgi:quinolinate synthase